MADQHFASLQCACYVRGQLQAQLGRRPGHRGYLGLSSKLIYHMLAVCAFAPNPTDKSSLAHPALHHGGMPASAALASSRQGAAASRQEHYGSAVCATLQSGWQARSCMHGSCALWVA